MIMVFNRARMNPDWRFVLEDTHTDNQFINFDLNGFLLRKLLTLKVTGKTAFSYKLCMSHKAK